MTPEELRSRIPESELEFSASRSSGPGGQNVNKVNTRVELRFCITRTSSLSEEEKSIILQKLKKRINSEGEIIVRAQSGRTQLKNREAAEERLFSLLAAALTRKPIRKPGSPTAGSKAERAFRKIKHSEIKKLRRSQDFDSGDDI